MKKYILLFVAIAFLSGCDKDNYNNNNKYLPNYNFSIDIDMNLPLYSPLQFTANPVRISQAGIGINGIIVMNTGSGYTAFEASCPNQALGSCSALTINGVNVVCGCDNVAYSLFTGLATTPVQYPLKPYRVQVVGQNTLRVYN